MAQRINRVNVSEGYTQIAKYKIIVLGPMSSGKTALTFRFCEGRYIEARPTVQTDYRDRVIRIDNENVLLQLWDTVGQERFAHSLTPSFYRNTDAVIFVFDITDLHSFATVNFWITECRRFVDSDVPMILIGTKCDMPEAISANEARVFADQHSMPMMDVDICPISTASIDTKEVVNKWLEKHKEGVMSESSFNDYWRTWVPKIYSPPINEPCLNWSFPEDEAARVLFQPLEMFICDDDPAALMHRLTQLDQPPAVCGRVFKMGEPTYSCRECGMDGTCVLCVDCFKNSEHRYHKYKMGTSGGGGCCDCGDKEAWKRAPFCDIHLKGVQQQDDKVNTQLPADFLERCRIVFDAVLWYAYDLLTLDQTMGYKFRDTSDMEDNDSYCTILYNDEIHTFEQVITTLTRTIKCDQRTSIEYVTNIDREGRAIVKCSNFIACNELKTDIQKYTSRPGNTPLNVLVVHTHTVAHQIFAMKLLVWLQTFLGHGESFRAVFAQVALKPQQSSPSIMTGIMLRDFELWKSARTHWHRLLISGMLLEYENKKSLAKIFTKNYGNIMKDFIKDDHDHTYSISSLSVQLFTVPTLAYNLIEQDEVLFILLNTFHSECKRLVNKQGKLEFDRTTPSQQFQRAQFILYDLRYLLGAVPEVWTDDLRRNFLRGLSMMLNILTMMQGMDSVVRQVGQHMEYEPEWKSAFNLHIKLSCAISLALKWCGADKVVLVKAYRATLARLQENPSYDPLEQLEVHELADHSVACLPYDVATKPVSIHVPLTRFLAGLHLHLDQHGLTFDSAELQVARPTPVQIIEPVVRTQVMVSQVHSGMWRRNGYALLNQLYFYRDVKCRTEMLDRDITLLQVGSALIESNEFLIHLLYKFQLLNWTHALFDTNALRGNEEDNMRQLVNLVEEFLQLLIMIVGERYIPGIANITTEDRVKKEIIQHLCIKPLPHSELNKCIPDDITYETGVDDVIEELANFKKPSSNGGKGVYELKPQYYEEYNVFYYHYSREELSKSEENMRQKRKASGKLECCPPPMLPKLSEGFNMVVNLLQCDVMLHIMKTVLERSLNLQARSFSELQLHKTLHLIGYGLQEEQTENYPFLLFSERARKVEIPKLLEKLLTSARVESHKDLIRWTLNKFKVNLNSAEQMTSQDISPTIDTTAKKAVLDDEKARRSKLAAERREKIMAQMTAAQNNFMKVNAELFEEAQAELIKNAPVSKTTALMMQPSTSETKQMICDDLETVALGPHQSSREITVNSYTCILCQEEQTVSANGPCLVMAAFVQQATVLCQYRGPDPLLDVSTHDPMYLNSNLGPAPHIGTCGHVMHGTCWQRYVDNVMARERKRPYRVRHPASFDVDRQEFLCPLCECLSNTVLPVVPALATLQLPPVPHAVRVQQQQQQQRERKRKVVAEQDVAMDEDVGGDGGVGFGDYLEMMEVLLGRKKKWCHGVFKSLDDQSPTITPTNLTTTTILTPMPTVTPPPPPPPVDPPPPSPPAPTTSAFGPIAPPPPSAITTTITSISDDSDSSISESEDNDVDADVASLATSAFAAAVNAAITITEQATALATSTAASAVEAATSAVEAVSAAAETVRAAATAPSAASLYYPLEPLPAPSAAKSGSSSSSAAMVECSSGCELEAHQVYYLHPPAAHGEDGEEPEVNVWFGGGCPSFGDELRDMIQVFAQVTYTRGLSVDPNPTDRRLAPVAWKSCAYTIHSIETLLRSEDEVNRPLLGHLSSRHRDCMENMVRTVAILGSTWKQSVVIIGHGLRLLGMIIENTDEAPSILQWDSFGMLVALTFSLPSLMNRGTPATVPMGGVLELHTLRIIFIAHIVKILITSDYAHILIDEEMDVDGNGTDSVYYGSLDFILGSIGRNDKRISHKLLWQHVKDSCKPFLRCCVLFYRYLTDVPAPSALTQIGGDTYENMCKYLGLTDNCDDLINGGGDHFDKILHRWCTHEVTVSHRRGTSNLYIPREPLRVNRLVDLPADFSELINTVSAFACPNSEHEDSRNPTMCLVCGEVLCSQSYCCQTDVAGMVVGACNAHAHKCGSGVGVFLRVRECEIMFLASPYRGCFIQPPYLDAYGETDQGLRRGNPLRLCADRYRRLSMRWLAHGIHEEIARTIETSNNILPTQWQHL